MTINKNQLLGQNKSLYVKQNYYQLQYSNIIKKSLLILY